MKKILLLVIVSLSICACDYNITFPSPVVNVNNSNTSTNTNTNNIDVHDIGNAQPIPVPSSGSVPSINGSPITPIAIPLGAREVALEVARLNPLLLANSCQDTLGHAAWGFMDLMILKLRQSDLRWGYVGKYGSCTNPSADAIAFKATSTDIGTWIIDIIANHCGSNPQFSWNVIGFDAAGKWCQVR